MQLEEVTLQAAQQQTQLGLSARIDVPMLLRILMQQQQLRLGAVKDTLRLLCRASSTGEAELLRGIEKS